MLIQRLSLLAAVLTISAFAQTTDANGVILIDQNRAQVGGIGPGDASGFPVTISEPGAYKLTSNLTAINGRAIEILISGVTLDLNGFQVQCPYVSRPGLSTYECVFATPNTSRVEMRNGIVIMTNTLPLTIGGTLGVVVNFQQSGMSVLEGVKIEGGHNSFHTGPYSRISKVFAHSLALSCPSLVTESINSGGFGTLGPNSPAGCKTFNSVGSWPGN